MKKIVARCCMGFLITMAVLTFLSWKLDRLCTPQVLIAEPKYGTVDDKGYECVLPKEVLHQEGSSWYIYIVEQSTSYFYPLNARRVEISIQALDDTQAAISGIYTDGLRVVRFSSRPLNGSTVPICLWKEADS